MKKMRFMIETRPALLLQPGELFIGTNEERVYANEFCTS
jgi:hypothetical protein